jgi:hypothetical protein
VISKNSKTFNRQLLQLLGIQFFIKKNIHKFVMYYKDFFKSSFILAGVGFDLIIFAAVDVFPDP